ncbi:MAG TPA: hypothetical protein VJS13_05995 [Pyrinomonadaceae bacterium]|nr:hypothetical protein [Pyrinomonadaceae bacterium]
MVGLLGFLATTQKVEAGTLEECNRAFGLCLVTECRGLSGQDYLNCRDACDRSYEDCRFDDDYHPDPVPLPVEDHSLSGCLEACQACFDLPDQIDGFFCNVECRKYCFDTYPKP